MKVLIAAGGSHGDILPFIALGREFQRAGHEVRFYGHTVFASIAEEAGLPFYGGGTREEYLEILQNPNTNHPLRSLKVIADLVDRSGREFLDAMAADIVPGETIIVNSVLAFGARAVAEINGIPSATVHLQPTAILRNCSERTPGSGAGAVRDAVAQTFKNLSWYLIDKLLLDTTVGAALNRRRAAFGLPPVDRPFKRWIHDSDALVGLFPEWFAPPYRDELPHLRLTGFPLYDGSSDALPAALEAFLARGEAPIAFTAGTATAASHAFFSVSAEACRRSGRRGILLTHAPEQVPDPLPSGVIHCAYAPFSGLLPRVSAFVHHGGIGTLSQALKAGVPQLIRPMAHDQFDNANRAVRLGVALKIRAREYRLPKVIKALERLSGDLAMRERCMKIAAKCSDDSIATACKHIVDMLAPMASNELGEGRGRLR